MTVPSWIMITATIGWLSGKKIADTSEFLNVFKRDVTRLMTRMVTVVIHRYVREISMIHHLHQILLLRHQLKIQRLPQHNPKLS